MVLELQDTTAALLAAAHADVRALTTRESLEDVIRVEEQVWGGNFDWIRQRLGDNLEIPGYLNVFAAYVDNEPACAAWVYFTRGGAFASLWGGSTVEKYRRRGLYTALLAARVQAARQRGYLFITIEAGPMSQPIVEKHGFRLLTRVRDFELEAKML
jgi:GNAT superfamily N-acetyltransferase